MNFLKAIYKLLTSDVGDVFFNDTPKPMGGWFDGLKAAERDVAGCDFYHVKVCYKETLQMSQSFKMGDEWLKGYGDYLKYLENSLKKGLTAN